MPFCGNFDWDWDMELGKPTPLVPVFIEADLDELPYWGA